MRLRVYYPGGVCVRVCELLKGKEAKGALSRQQRITQWPCVTQRLSLPQPVAGKRIKVCFSSADWAGIQRTVVTHGSKTIQALHWVDQHEWAPSKKVFGVGHWVTVCQTFWAFAQFLSSRTPQVDKVLVVRLLIFLSLKHNGPTVGRLKCFGRHWQVWEQICSVCSAVLVSFGTAWTASAPIQHEKSEKVGCWPSEPSDTLIGCLAVWPF